MKAQKPLFENTLQEVSIPANWKKAYKELSNEGVDSEHVFITDTWDPKDYIEWAKQYGANLKPSDINAFADGYHDYWMKLQF